MNYTISHTTTYLYTDPVSLCHNLIHLRPRHTPRQTSTHWQMLVQPDPRVLDHHHDYFGNPVTQFAIQEPHKKLSITAKHRVEVKADAVELAHDARPWEAARDQLASDRSPAVLDACQYAFDSHYVKCSRDLAAYAAPSFAPGRPLVEAALDLIARIHREFRYDAKATTLATPLAEVLTKRHGVCQDFAHLALGCLRSLGLAARYVSGYLQTKPPPGRPRLVGADASHAWLAIFSPAVGWIELDPTNNVVPSEQHVTIAWGRDYDDVSPIKGVILGGGAHTMTVAVDVAAS